MHIPKTAGTSLRALIAAAYAPTAVLDVRLNALHEIAAKDLPHYRCFMAHAGPNLLPFIPAHSAVITLVRDPIERAISVIYFHQSRLMHQPEIFAPAYRARMQPWLQADLRTWLDAIPISNNPQTRLLGSRWNLRPYFNDGEIGRSGEFLLEPLHFHTLNNDEDMGQIAERAHQQLAQMAVVGITECFAESMGLICNLLGMPLPKQIPEKNIGMKKGRVQAKGYRAQTAPDLLERIAAENQYDQALYAHASELFAAQLARQRANPARTISLAAYYRTTRRQVKKTVRAHLPEALLAAIQPSRQNQPSRR